MILGNRYDRDSNVQRWRFWKAPLAPVEIGTDQGCANLKTLISEYTTSRPTDTEFGLLSRTKWLAEPVWKPQ